MIWKLKEGLEGDKLEKMLKNSENIQNFK